jgi:hypothetical protein
MRILSKIVFAAIAIVSFYIQFDRFDVDPFSTLLFFGVMYILNVISFMHLIQVLKKKVKGRIGLLIPEIVLELLFVIIYTVFRKDDLDIFAVLAWVYFGLHVFLFLSYIFYGEKVFFNVLMTFSVIVYLFFTFITSKGLINISKMGSNEGTGLAVFLVILFQIANCLIIVVLNIIGIVVTQFDRKEATVEAAPKLPYKKYLRWIGMMMALPVLTFIIQMIILRLL